MSWDIHVQGFRRGEAAPIDASALRDVLGPWIVADESDDDFWRVRAVDGGEADVHGVAHAHEGVMVNHLGAGKIVDLLVTYAVKAGAVILAPGCRTMITNETNVLSSHPSCRRTLHLWCGPARTSLTSWAPPIREQGRQ